MTDKSELVRTYLYLAAQKKQYGYEMGRIETQLEQLEKQLALSHPNSMVLRREGQKLVDIAGML